MAISERERHRLHQSLDELMGEDVAAILMSHLPPVGWADVATKHDLAELEGRLVNQLRIELHREIGGLRTELQTEIGGLRTELHREIGGLRTELQTEIAGLRTELHTEIGLLRAEMHAEIGGLRTELQTEIAGLRTELHTSLQTMTRTYLLGNIALVVTIAALAFGAARLV